MLKKEVVQVSGRKSVRGVSIDNVYQTRLTADEKKHIQSTLVRIKRMLTYSRQYANKSFCYSTNGAIIADALTDYQKKLEKFLVRRGVDLEKIN